MGDPGVLGVVWLCQEPLMCPWAGWAASLTALQFPRTCPPQSHGFGESVSTRDVSEAVWGVPLKSLQPTAPPTPRAPIVRLPACMLSLQSPAALCDPEPPGSSVHGILQGRILSGLPFHSPGDLPDPGIEPASPGSPACTRGFFATSATWGAPGMRYHVGMTFRKHLPRHPA